MPAVKPNAALALTRFFDAAFKRLCQAAAVFVIVVSALLVIVLIWRAWESITTNGIGFFTSTTWDPVHRVFGGLAFVWGTVATSAIAMLIAVPLGVGTAAYLSEIATGWVRRIGSFFVEMLAAVPSIVYGFWGLFVLAPQLQKLMTALGGPNTGGTGIVPAGLILSIMIVPYIAAVSFDVCRAVPSAQREAALALGATRWQTIWRTVLPYARPGIIGGSFLALGRALGETMAVTMLIGNRTEISLSPFALGNSIASIIANEFTEADYDLYLSALVELGLLLLLVSVVVNTLARVLIARVTQQRRGLSPFLAGLAVWRNFPFPRARGLVDASVEHSSAVTASKPLTSPAAPVPLVGSRAALAINHLMTCVLGLCLIVTIAPLFFILINLIVQGVESLDWNFFTKIQVPVGEKGGGLANAIVGSLILVGLATLFAVPLGLLAAIYLAEYRSDKLGPTVRFIAELLGGVPSIVIGIFIYYLTVKPPTWLNSLGLRFMGRFSAWAGSLALAVMMIPIVLRASEEALKLVPRSIRNASVALGASHYQTILRIVVPAALPAIITAVFLSIARIAGETAPLLLTAFGNKFWPRSLNEPCPSLPVSIYNYALSAYDDWHRQAWAAALVLMMVVMFLNVGVRLVTGKRVLLASRAE
jgi:phosphate transport system permease protein